MDKKAEGGWGDLTVALVILVILALVLLWIFAPALSKGWTDFKAQAYTEDVCKKTEGMYPIMNTEDGTFKSCQVCPKTCSAFDASDCTKGFCELTCKLVDNKCVAG